MKKMITWMLTALILLSCFSGCAMTEEGPGENPFGLKTVKEGYLTILTSPDYAPYEFYALDEDGDPVLAGFDMALAKYIADYLGLTLEVIPVSFNGIPDELAAGAGDLAIAGLSPDPDRLLKMDFTDIYYEGKQAFVTLADKASQFTDLNSTNNSNFSIAAQTGSIQMDLANEFSSDAQIVSLTKATDIIAELISGQIDGAYIEWDVAKAYQANYSQLTIVCEVPYEAEGNVIGVSKGNADLMKHVNDALKQCIDSGEFAKFVAQALEQAAGDNYQGMLDENGNVPQDPGNAE